jgi:hypothetical protein
MALTDHFYSGEQLESFGNKVKAGEECEVAVEIQEGLELEVDDDLLEQLRELNDPELRERYRKREERIIIALIVAVLAWIAWMVYRFLFN